MKPSLAAFVFAALFSIGSLAFAAAPAAPELVKISWIDNRAEFLVRWSPVPNATAYNGFRYDTNASVWVQIATNLIVGHVPMLRDPAQPNPGTISYSVSAVNADGESAATSASLTPTPFQWFS